MNDEDSDRICHYQVCRDIPNFMSSVGTCGTYGSGRVNDGKCRVDGVCDSCGCSCKHECDDKCPKDSSNDIDSDRICGDLDSCPFDRLNDMDSDKICGNIDSCPNDAWNDIDSDKLCRKDDVCPNDALNDVTKTKYVATLIAVNMIRRTIRIVIKYVEMLIVAHTTFITMLIKTICGDIDSCAYDKENDADSDMVCGNMDSCPMIRIMMVMKICLW